MIQDTGQEFFSWSSLGTVAGAAFAVVVVGNTARKLLKIDSPWIPFLVSLLIALFGAYEAGKLATAPDYVLAFFNSCLLFWASTGMNQSAVELKPQPTGEMKPYGRGRVKWLSPWLKRIR